MDTRSECRDIQRRVERYRQLQHRHEVLHTNGNMWYDRCHVQLSQMLRDHYFGFDQCASRRWTASGRGSGTGNDAVVPELGLPFGLLWMGRRGRKRLHWKTALLLAFVFMLLLADVVVMRSKARSRRDPRCRSR